MMTITAAARALGVSTKRIKDAISSGRIGCIDAGRRVLVDLDEIRKAGLARPGVGIQAISDRTGLSMAAIRRGIREGWLPHWRDGRKLMFDSADVMDAIRQQMKKGL